MVLACCNVEPLHISVMVLCYTIAFQQSTSGNGLAVTLVISFPHTVLFTYLLLFYSVVSLCRLNRLHVRSYLRPMYFFCTLSMPIIMADSVTRP